MKRFLAHRSLSRSEDETEIRASEGIGRKGREGHPPRDAAAFFSGGQDPHCVGGPSRRGKHCRALRREGIVQNLYYRWSKDFLEAGKKRLAGDTARAATSDEVKDLRREASALKEVVAELTLENRLLKKSMTADGRSNRGKRLRREDAA
jgi:transposase-like protein